MNHMIAYLAGWFDPLEKRIGYMEKLDAALTRPRNTTKIELRFNPWI